LQDAGKDMAREEKVKRQKHLGRYFLVHQQLRSASKMWVSPTKIREFIKETQCQLTKNKYGGLTNTNDVENHLKKRENGQRLVDNFSRLSEWL
jgi:hypothetical protein